MQSPMEQNRVPEINLFICGQVIFKREISSMKFAHELLLNQYVWGWG